MTNVAIISVIVILALLSAYRWGRKSFEVKRLKQDVKAGEKINDTVKKQRDNHIDSVDDADRMWRDRDED